MRDLKHLLLFFSDKLSRLSSFYFLRQHFENNSILLLHCSYHIHKYLYKLPIKTCYYMQQNTIILVLRIACEFGLDITVITLIN